MGVGLDPGAVGLELGVEFGMCLAQTQRSMHSGADAIDDEYLELPGHFFYQMLWFLNEQK